MSGQKQEAIDKLNLLVTNGNQDAKYIMGLLYNDASTLNLCDINDFSKKEWVFSTPKNASSNRSQFLKGGDIIFSKSRVGLDSCNVYRLRLPHGVYDVQNCDSIAYFTVR